MTPPHTRIATQPDQVRPLEARCVRATRKSCLPLARSAHRPHYPQPTARLTVIVNEGTVRLLLLQLITGQVVSALAHGAAWARLLLLARLATARRPPRPARGDGLLRGFALLSRLVALLTLAALAPLALLFGLVVLATLQVWRARTLRTGPATTDSDTQNPHFANKAQAAYRGY